MSQNYIASFTKPIKTNISHEISMFYQLTTSFYDIFRIEHLKYQYTSILIRSVKSNNLLSDHDIETNENIQNYQPITLC